MKALIVEDELTTRMLLSNFLKKYGTCEMVENGRLAVESFRAALDSGSHYDLICMDINMPEMNGQEALQAIRAIEAERGLSGPNEVKVVMITSLSDPKNVVDAYFKGYATDYLTKPVDYAVLFELLKRFELIAE